MSGQAIHGKAAVKTYLLVFAGLAVLTGVTVGLSYMHMPVKTAVALATLIAVTKCTLIGAFFMHLRFERWLIHFFLYTALAFVLLLLFLVLPDIGIG